MQQAIEIKNLKKYFGKTKAVDNISFDVEQGEIFGFLGPNGAGKTTTIRLIMDFIRPDSGSIKIMGLDCQKDSIAVKKQISYLSSDVRLYDNYSGQYHINFLEKLHGQKSIAKKLAEKLNLNLKAQFKTLSTGNKQKLGLILALMFEPKVIILDEPTAGLDPILQNTVYEILAEFQSKGSTIFMSSHNLSEVERICSKVAIIRAGKIVALENIQTLKDKRMHKATVRFEGKFTKSDFNFDGVKV
ncbi:MAG: ABC transporter ATP-binding protein, partial [Patescibacteria group bacterium]|nr:ABC transporter ATP-binding protein [Patescibacteria group bacterium]